VGKISDGEITVLSQKKTMRYLIFERIGEFPLTEQQILYRILLNITTDRNDRSFLTETGISYTGILLVLNELLAYFTGEKRKKRIMCIITCCMAVLYDFPPVLIQQVIFRILSFTDTERKRQTGIGLVLMMTIDPACINTVSFLLPAVYRLSSCFPENSRIMPVMITSMIQSVKYHLVNPLQIILFPVLRRLTGWLWIFCLMQLFLPFPFVSAFYLLDHLFRIMNYADLPSDIRGPGLLLFLPLVYVMRKCRKSALISLCLLYVFMYAGLFHPFAEVTCINVGQGDCIHVKTPSGRNYLIDGGGSSDYDTGLKVVKPYLLKNGVRRIDAAFVTHLHEDHYGGIKSLAADGMIEKIAVYEANKQMENILQEETKAELIYLYGGMKVELDESCFIEVIAPERETDGKYRELIANTDDENDLSLIMKLNYDGKSVLITGDIDDDGEGNLVSKYGEHLDSDIMKVPHHGSKYSSSDPFVDAVSPVLAVFQVGKNNYGHPAPDVLSRYRARGCENVRNDKSGAIGVSVNEEALKVVCMIH
jgi:beta-lactamase superfamily II metal-dependent hydrolase